MKRHGLLFLAASVLAGCVGPSDPTIGGTQSTATDDAATIVPAPARSQESFEKEEFYTRVENGLLSRGLLRSDGGGPDTPFTDEVLARNFLAIAFSEEFSRNGGLVSARPRSSNLHRWTEPVELDIVFGETIAASDADRDRAEIEAYAGRLARVTDHPIVPVSDRGNFTVFVLHDQNLRTIGPELRSRLPEISDAEVDFVQSLPLDAYCIVLTSDPANSGEISRAAAVIRGELPDALRTACIHEDVAQGLGLANDSDFARPSIFKDDDEFGRLTTHDELLLSILYDERLTPGMTEAEATPIVKEIARALTESGT